jgi:hypothetical protein
MPTVLRILPTVGPTNSVLLRRKALDCVSAVPQPSTIEPRERDSLHRRRHWRIKWMSVSARRRG